ncbi:hypothetical protein TURU_035760 [Turdus rufiventris]|nr:hypothetical protein TURU_035760 [Turdus rufiventris]
MAPSSSAELGQHVPVPRPHGPSQANKHPHAMILLLFGNFVAHGSSLPTTERLIIGCGLCMDKERNACQHPAMRLIVCAACNREITVIQPSVNMVQFMIPVVRDVSKHVTTGMKLDHATSPALQGVTAQQI